MIMKTWFLRSRSVQYLFMMLYIQMQIIENQVIKSQY